MYDYKNVMLWQWNVEKDVFLESKDMCLYFL